ncbi:MAG TPA: hypothetical protein VLG47_03225 [Candidatus Saccharimonadales bacterium]|nr:hypothetical protein [Candidatus Saccharimonadales bacterium]
MGILHRNRAPALHSIDAGAEITFEEKVTASMLAGLLILAGCTSSSASRSVSESNTPTAAAGSSGNTVPSTPNIPTAPSSDYVSETAEWSAPIFDKLTVGAAKIGKTVAGHSYTVICRIPPNSGQPKSVRKGGWYAVPDKDGLHNTAWVAANTFENGPMPNDNPYDANVPVCSPKQETQAWYSDPGRAIDLIGVALAAGRSQATERLAA